MFSVGGLKVLAARGPADRIAKATETTAKNTTKLLEKNFGGSAFA